MRCRSSRAVAAALSLLAPSLAHAQYDRASCLVGNDQGNGLEVAVDRLGVVHLVHVDRVLGTLYATRWAPGAAPVRENVALNVSRLGVIEVDDTGLDLDAAGEPRVCFYDATARALKVGLRGAGGWSVETVLAAANAGDTCDLRVAPDDAVHVVFHHDSQLQHARRRGANDWVVAAADTVGGRNVGLDPSLRFTADGRLVVAHGDGTNGELRVSTRAADGRWTTVSGAVAGSSVGLSPRLTLNPRGEVEIAHGVRPGAGQSSDAGLVLTSGPVSGPLRSVMQNGAFLGGSNGADADGDRLFVATRELQRNAIFGNLDSLKLFEGLPDVGDELTLETYPADPRHLFRNVTLDVGPGGEPVLAYLVEIAPSFFGPGGAYVCVIRPTDTDADLLPDRFEGTLGSDPARADTDGDGRADGLEWILDGTHPSGAIVPPDAEVPLPDAALPVDAAPPVRDAEVVPPIDDAEVRPERDVAVEPPDEDAETPAEDAETPPDQDAGTPAEDAETPPDQDAGTPAEDDAAVGPDQDAAVEPDSDLSLPADLGAPPTAPPTSPPDAEDAGTDDPGFSLPDVGPTAGSDGGASSGCSARPGHARGALAVFALAVLALATGRRRRASKSV
jgi:hypothetical protein